jgi:hypothetical protein
MANGGGRPYVTPVDPALKASPAPYPCEPNQRSGVAGSRCVERGSGSGSTQQLSPVHAGYVSKPSPQSWGVRGARARCAGGRQGSTLNRNRPMSHYSSAAC